MSHTIRDKRRAIRWGIRCAVNPGCYRACSAAGINRGEGHVEITNSKSRTVRYGIRAGFEGGAVAVDIPAIGEVSRSAEIIPAVVHEPRLTALKGHDGVDLPAFQ